MEKEDKLDLIIQQNRYISDEIKFIEELLKNTVVNKLITDTENLFRRSDSKSADEINEHRNEDLLLIRGLQGEIDNQNERISSLQKELNEKNRIIEEQREHIDNLERQKKEENKGFFTKYFNGIRLGDTVSIKRSSVTYWSVIGNKYSIPSSHYNFNWKVVSNENDKLKISSSGITILVMAKDVYKIKESVI